MKPDRPQWIRRYRRSLNLSFSPSETFDGRSRLTATYYRQIAPWQASVRESACGTPSRQFRKYDPERRDAVSEILGNRARAPRQVKYPSSRKSHVKSDLRLAARTIPKRHIADNVPLRNRIRTAAQEPREMARVTVEDCIDKVENRFDLVLLASHRARMISSGTQIAVERDNDKNPVVALREIAETGDFARGPQGGTGPFPAEIRRGRRARARGGAADRRARHRRRCRRYRGHHRPHDRGRAAQGPRGPDASGKRAEPDAGDEEE